MAAKPEPVARTAAKAIAKAPVHAYRWTLKPLIGWECRHLPSCSEYALEAIDRKPFAADQTSRDARLHHALEHAPEDIAVAEALVPGTRERRVVGDRVFDAQAIEPAVSEVHLHLPAQ